MRRTRLWLSILTSATLATAACGDDDTSGSGGAGGVGGSGGADATSSSSSAGGGGGADATSSSGSTGGDGGSGGSDGGSGGSGGSDGGSGGSGGSDGGSGGSGGSDGGSGGSGGSDGGSGGSGGGSGGSDGGSGGSDGGSGGSGGAGGSGGGDATPPAGEDWTRDILSTALELDLASLTGRATIVLAASDSTAASFQIGDLDIASVTGPSGALAHAVSSGQLDVGVPPTGSDATIIIDYAFKPHTEFDGWMPGSGVSFLWPYFCGNLFPCKSDPADGVRFTLRVTGVPEGMTAVYPESIPTAAPAYMPAIAVDELTRVELGTTTAGTRVSVWHLPGQEADAASGTEHLVEVFDFFETTYGPYPFGDSVGTVSADWGGGDYGGMEHHPFWHVSSGSLYSEEVNAHEAAHGWFGNGVRIACWEDFILSEGTATYLAARALGEAGVDAWADYECTLKSVCDPAEGRNAIALPDTCNAIDILNHPLWSSVPYMKGAFFFREVAEAIGVDVLDRALAGFYTANVGNAARTQDLLDAIKAATDAAGAAAVDALAADWLRTLECPVDFATLCPT
ncbi:M1 family metallopeptidase [Sorangium sp. So ce406]|uniref:M1 family metallopeptidase n=1 Tax=Sorangium sp. So ce406 TaxID=3133311 RepID=UPI003F5C1846